MDCMDKMDGMDFMDEKSMPSISVDDDIEK